MIRYFYMRIVQSFEFIKYNGILRYLKETIYFRRKTIIVQKNLDEAKFDAEFLKRNGVRFLEINANTYPIRTFEYAEKNRHLKALYYLSCGYNGHALVKSNKIIADIWYCGYDRFGHLPYHPDLDWFGIKLIPGEVYSFDIYLIPDERGNNLSAVLQDSACYDLFKKGNKRAFGYYWADNTPAVWNTRVINRWKKVGQIRVTRLLFSHKFRVRDKKADKLKQSSDITK